MPMTMFSNAFFARDFFSMAPMRPQAAYGHSHHLGQSDYRTLSPDERAKAVGTIQEGLNDSPALNDVIALSADMNIFHSFMDPDAIAFLQLSNDAAALYPGVRALYDRLLSGSAEDWYASPTELAAADAWLAKIEQMYKLYQAHFQNTPAASSPVVNMGPNQVPLTRLPSGVPAPRTSGTPAAAFPAHPPAPKILGVDANSLLVGGGVAVGLGLLLYAIS